MSTQRKHFAVLIDFLKMGRCTASDRDFRRHFIANGFAVVLLAYSLCGTVTAVGAQDAQWIWTPEHPRGAATEGDCYFRKTMQLSSVERATVTITADDQYELFVNGRKIGTGNSIRQMEQYDVSGLLVRGRNVIGVRVTNLSPGPAAVAARVLVQPKGAGALPSDWHSYSTDGSWRTSLEVNRDWASSVTSDSHWKPAQVFGILGETAPWDRREEASPTATSENQRFRISSEFAVQEILGDDVTGSLVNMAFNEFGHIIAAQERGPLLLLYDSDKDGMVDKKREYCDLVQGIQGILPLNGDVFVTGLGPEGNGVYRLLDKDRNGALEEAHKIVSFKGDLSEHGAHGLTLGPDGRIYCVLGNHVSFEGEFAESSPLKVSYEGDLVGPRYEDPGGHAAGIKAPGGTVIRFDTEGKSVELVAGGLRNAYDLAFHPNGRLYVHDSDMESDEGSAWYRPTSLYEVSEGAEYGWRSGWAKWPSYYFDRMPTLLETGRGSPTGACVYDHINFPQRYHGCLFLADWTQGQILSVKFAGDGSPQSEVFIQGQPLNVTDLTVGPDGCLYFCTGGRGTKGGIYQVRWMGTVPAELRDLGDGVARAIKQPQLDAPWARQSIAALKRELGSSWSEAIAGVAFSDDNPAKFRLRALEVMQLFGPTPSPELLTALAKSSNEAVRVRATQLMGLVKDTDSVSPQLEGLLADSDPDVQYAACESLLRCAELPPSESLIPALTPLLASPDRRQAWAARRLLERLPTDVWQSSLLAHSEQRVQLQAGLALVIADPTREHGQAVINMSRTLLAGFVSDRNFVDLLRLIQITLHRCDIPASDLTELSSELASEFPVAEPILNRELFRLLAYLNADEVVPAAIGLLQSDSELTERMHIALHLRFFQHQWTSAERFAVVKFFEETQSADAGSSVPLYVMNVTRDLCRDLSLEEARIFVAQGAKWPNAALISLFRYPEKLSASDLQTLRKLDQSIDQTGFDGEHYKRLKTGIVAMLSQNADADSLAYLREIWIRSPERRQAVALGLAQQPTDEDWDYLVRSLPVLESFAVGEVMDALCKIPIATDEPQAFREVILHGLRMEQDDESPAPAIKLLSYWTGENHATLAEWQTWFAVRYPDSPEAKLPEFEKSSPWSVDTLSEYFLSSDGRKGDLAEGRAVFDRATCSKCHRMGSVGTAIGPDLSAVAKRFTRKEVLESILFPSHVISDQYRTQRVLTTDGRVFSGQIVENVAGSLTVRDSSLNERVIAEQDVEQIQPSKASLMPSGLLDTLSGAEIRDLLTYMGFVPAQSQTASRTSESSTR
jgi:putative heme-binding domain-containing protein